MTMFPSRSVLSLVSVAVLSLSALQAGVGYQSDSSVSSREIALVGEFGNQIILKSDAAQPLLTGFTFEYESNYSMPKGLVVRFYANDGGGDVTPPGTLLYQSSPFDIALGRSQVAISYNSVPVPKSFTYTVEFLGNDGDNVSAGLLTPDKAPSTGQAFNDIWLRLSGGSWQNRQLVPVPGYQGYAMFTAQATVNDGPGLVISSPVANQIKVSWQDATYKLQRRDAATSGTWADVANVTGTAITMPVTGTLGFFRLITR